MVKFTENIIVGDGIMAKQLIFALKDQFPDILCISSLDFAPACSLTSTALNCLRGAEKGISPLGDLIVDAHEEFECFVDKYNPAGVTRTKEIQTWSVNGPTHKKWLRRYKDYNLVSKIPFLSRGLRQKLAMVSVDAFVIDTKYLFDWYSKNNTDIKKVNDFILNIEKTEGGYRLLGQSGDVFECKSLYLCTSYMSDHFSSLCLDSQTKMNLSKHKKVYGNYLHYKIPKGTDLGLDLKESFCLSYNFLRLIYRKESDELLLSMDDTNKGAFVTDKSLLKRKFNSFIEALELIDLPEFESWSIKTGIRSKGFRRIPFCGEINDSLYVSTGLYKNAFSFAYLFSKKLLELKL